MGCRSISGYLGIDEKLTLLGAERIGRIAKAPWRDFPELQILFFKIVLIIISFLQLINSASADQSREVTVFSNGGCRYVETADAFTESILLRSKINWNGRCKDGYLDGLGTLTISRVDGTSQIVTGNYSRGKENGFGELVSKKGSIIEYSYVGQFMDGYLHGFGKLTYEDGIFYEGDFFKGERHGLGRLTQKDIEFSGQFIENQLLGEGVIEAKKTGVRYVGGVKGFKRHGWGVVTSAQWRDLGNWIEGVPEGFHVFENINGDSLFILFENGKEIDKGPTAPFAITKRKCDSDCKEGELVEVNAEMLTLLDTKSVRRLGEIRSFWSLINYRYKQGALSSLSSKHHEEVDCKRDQFRVTFVYWFSGRNGAGQGSPRNFLEMNHPDSKWHPIPPNSIAAQVRSRVCEI